MRNKKNDILIDKSQRRFDYFIGYPALFLLAVICVLPFWIILVGSFMDNNTILLEGFSLYPKHPTLTAYKIIFENARGVLSAYWVTIRVTLIGTMMTVSLSTLAGYVLSRKEFVYRNKIMFLFYFSQMFGGGLVPYYYMMTAVLDLKGTLTAQWFAGMLGTFNIILIRTFISNTVPDEMCEAAKIDGAGHGVTFGRIVLPLLKPAIATITLFSMLARWNDWYNSSLFSSNSKTWSLQFYLHNMVNRASALSELAADAGVVITDVPGESVKMAMGMLATGPILLVYPFLQKYFVSGITVGAVKG